MSKGPDSLFSTYTRQTPQRGFFIDANSCAKTNDYYIRLLRALVALGDVDMVVAYHGRCPV